MPKWVKLLICLIVCFTVAAAGSAVTYSSITTWYAGLTKPFFNPPNWIFGPVWTLLYFLMAISLYLVWSKPKAKKTKPAVMLFALQLGLNFLWSFLFFYLHQPLLALLGIIGLWLAILLTYRSFSQINKTAGYLLIPYLLWVSFASLLNLAIVVLN